MQETTIKEYSLSDFIDVPGQDIMGRAQAFTALLEQYRNNQHYQYKRIAVSPSGPVRHIKDMYTGEIREMLYFASNDYLNLSNHSKVIQAGIDAMHRYGAGAGSVPLLGGTTELHIQLEQKIAAFKGCEAAIIHTSGYGSNCSSLLSMLNDKDIAIVDMLAHASLIDGCKNTNTKYFKHNDADSLAAVLKIAAPKYRTKLVVIDGVYSMDGDIAVLDKIKEVAEFYGAYIMVDEAHATGVLGVNGRGTPEHFGLSGEIDIVCGTFSKGLGCVGGFIATNQQLADLLHFYSRGYMFSTAMTPQVAGSLIAALDVIDQEPERRQRLWHNIRYFKAGLDQIGLNIGNSETAIFPIISGNDFVTKEICRELHMMNIYANPVLYPAVSKRLSRVRFSIMSEHTLPHLDRALEALDYLARKYNLTKQPLA